MLQKLLIVPLALLTLTHCGTTTPEDDITRQIRGDVYYPATPPAKHLLAISVPILKPLTATTPATYRITPDGSYIAHYPDLPGGEYITITGTPRNLTSPHTFSPNGNVTVMGKSVPFYFSGNEDPEISTWTFTLTHPDGRRGTYQINSGGSRGNLEKRLPSLGW
jgi:hypothetical protein